MSLDLKCSWGQILKEATENYQTFKNANCESRVNAYQKHVIYRIHHKTKTKAGGLIKQITGKEERIKFNVIY